MVVHAPSMLGKVNVKRVKAPTLDSQAIDPPRPSIAILQKLNPMPDPCPDSVVV